MKNGLNEFYLKVKSKSYIPKNICEIGVFIPEESNILAFINDNIPTTLVEADPICIDKINKFFKDYKNIDIIEAAVYDKPGKVELCRITASTFISELSSSPALVNDGYKKADKDKFTANAILFSDIDKGNFDLISIDIEGAEWFVLKHMNSRPNILSIETHGKYYTNPNIDKINNWLEQNNYKIWYKDKSDTVYIKNGTFLITTFEKMQLILINIKLKLVKQKKYLKKILGKSK